MNPKKGKLYEISHISFCYDSITYREWPDGGTLSVAYEHLPLGSGNDWDYTDLVVDIQTIGKTYNSDLAHLYFTFIPEDRTARYRYMMNFSINLDICSEGGVYELAVNGLVMETNSFAADDYLNVTIIADSSMVTYGMTMIMLYITFDAPSTFTFSEWDADYYHGDGGNLFFHPYIKVLRTGEEIHICDDRMVTVPIDWMWAMTDGTAIYTLYYGVTDNSPNPPDFTKYWWTS